MKKHLAKLGTLALSITPVLALAQSVNTGYWSGFLTALKSLINLALPVLLAIAVLAVFYGLAKFIFSAGNEESRKEARQIMIWGIIAIAVMVSIFGLVTILQNTFGTAGGTVTIPTLP